MAGHSKWSNIKRRKGAADAKRGKIFTKLSKEIMVSARIGGGDVDANPRLRLAVKEARANSMPADNIARAIKKGTGELEGGAIEEMVYEGYGPGGVAFILDVATDNQNRTLAEVRTIFDKSGGSLGKAGSVAYLFSRKGMLRFVSQTHQEETLMEAALEAGAEDFSTEDDHYVVYTAVADFHAVQEALEARDIRADAAELTMIPANTVACDQDLAEKTLKLLDKLEDHDDIQSVWANFDLSDEVLEALDR